jgi:GxxExxY protein
MSTLRHEKLTYELQGIIFEVRKQLKADWPEEIYHQGMVQRLQQAGIPTQSKLRRAILHRGVEIHALECDLLAWDSIILELKVLPYSRFAPAHYAQLIHYLKGRKKDLGLLVNFGRTRAEVERLLWDEPKLLLVKSYESLTSKLSNTNQALVNEIQLVVTAIGEQYGLGYPETLYRKALTLEFNQTAGLQCRPNILIPAYLDDHMLAQHISDHLLVNDTCLMSIRSLLEYPTQYDFARMKTYLNSLKLPFGLIINFGKHALQIYGVPPT